MSKIIHSMIRVLDEKKSVEFYHSALGLNVAERFQFENFTLVYLRNAENDAELELTINHDRVEPYVHGDGYGHLAVAVQDLDAEHIRMKDAGLSPLPISEMHHDGALMARFFFIRDPDGYKIEVLQHHGRFS